MIDSETGSERTGSQNREIPPLIQRAEVMGVLMLGAIYIGFSWIVARWFFGLFEPGIQIPRTVVAIGVGIHFLVLVYVSAVRTLESGRTPLEEIRSFWRSL